MEYQVVSAGVNEAPGQRRLAWAEKDAADIAAFVGSAQGPLRGSAPAPLRGGGATRRSILSAIREAGLLSDYLLFYFSGHGGERGIETADGLLEYEKLVRVIESVGAPHTMVVLDVCQAASYLDYFLKEAQVEVGGLEGLASPSWLEMLAEATPSMRLVFSSGADRLSAESAALANGREVRNGHFTHSLLEVLKRAGGDLTSEDGEHTWISDERAFVFTRSVMRRLFGDDQDAVAVNLTGDFPLALSQLDAPIGDATFLSAKIEAGHLAIDAFVEGREALDTRVRWEIRDRLGTALERGTAKRRAREEYQPVVTRLPIPPLGRHATVRRQILSSGAARLVAIVRLEDATGREYDRRVIPFTYR